MKTIRIEYYLAKWDKHIVDDAISIWTGIWNWGTPPVSHVEGVTDAGNMYTSTMRGEENGVVKRPIKDVIQNPDRWRVQEIILEDEDYWQMICWMNAELMTNKGYDTWTLLKFFLPFGRKSSNKKFICSEFVQEALVMAGFFSKRKLWSPRRLWKEIEKQNNKLKA